MFHLAVEARALKTCVVTCQQENHVMLTVRNPPPSTHNLSIASLWSIVSTSEYFYRLIRVPAYLALCERLPSEHRS